MKQRKQLGWAVKWVQPDRYEEFLGGWRADRLCPAFFKTRDAARQWRDEHYGYIRARKDLQREPHGWRLPKIVRAEVVVREVKR